MKIRYVFILLISIFVSSCACYNCPKVYKHRGIPVDVSRPRQKNLRQNKYSPKNPYYSHIKNNLTNIK